MGEMWDRVDRGMFVFAVQPGLAATAGVVLSVLTLLTLAAGLPQVAIAAGAIAFLCFVVAVVRIGDEARTDGPGPAERARTCPSCGDELLPGVARVIIRGEAYCADQRCTQVAW